MANALTLDIIIDQDGSARRAVEEFSNALQKAGVDAESAAKHVAAYEKEMNDATTAARKAAEAKDRASGAARGQTQALGGLTTALQRYAGPAVIGAAVLRTMEWADSLSDLANKHRMTTDTVQKLGIVAERNGSTFERYADLMEGASDRIARGNAKTVDALAAMGLEIEEMRRLDPFTLTSELAEGLSRIEDAGDRAAVRLALFGEAGGDAAQMLSALTLGLDDVTTVVDGDMIDAGDKAISMWERFKGTVQAVTHEAILQSINPFVQLISYVDDLTTSLDDAAESAERLRVLDPGRPKGWGGVGYVPADPFAGAGTGQTWAFLNKSGPRLAKGNATGGGVTPYTQNQWDGIMQVLGPANPLGGGGLGSFPGFAALPRLGSGASPISFANGSGLMGTVPMNAPGGGGGSWLSNLFKGKGGQMAGAGLGMLTSFFGSKLGLSGTGSSIGSTVGSFFGPLGSGLGSLAGGLIGKLFGGGNQDKKQLASLKGGEDFTAIKAKADELGISMDKVFSAKKVEDFQKALKGVTDQIAAQEAESNRVKSAMERWGLTIEDMGPKFKQTEMDKTAKTFMEDFTDLVGAGADVNKVIEKMGPEIGKFVHSSIEMGTQVPLEMKKIIEKMIEQGTLLDKNGEKFTDISQIPFAENLNTQFSSLITKLDALLDRVFGLGDAFDRAAGSAGNFNREAGNTPTDPTIGSGSGPDHVSGGGLVTGNKVLHFNRGGFVPRGTDTVPAMLTPGEMITSAGATRDILHALRNQPENGGEVGVFVIQATDTEAALLEFQRRFPRMASSGKIRQTIRKVAS